MDVVEIARELISINSENPPGNEVVVTKFISDYLNDLKIDADVVSFGKDRCSVVASIGSGDGLMLNGHIDTVPIGDRSLWKNDPMGEVVGDNLYGRGSSDMKGGVACILASLNDFDTRNLKRKLLLTFVGDEEAGFRGSTDLLKNHSEIFKEVSHGVIAEPTNMKLQIAQKGMMDVKVRFSGKSAHGSMPSLGDNAVYKASRFVSAVQRRSLEMRVSDDLLGKGTFNVGKIVGGTKVNVVPEACEVEIDRRLVPGETRDYAIGEIKNILRDLHIDAIIEIVNAKNPFKLDKNSRILSVMREVTGADTFVATGYTEAEIYKSMANIDCLVFGPGNKETIHTSSEFVSLENLRKCSQAFGKLVKKWCA